MSSSSTSNGLSRARSLRKPSTKSETTSSSGEGQRNVSPSRLPVKGLALTTTTTRPSRSATTSAASTKAGRPLSGVFTRLTSSSLARQRENDSPGPEAPPAAASRLTRTASTRQSSTSSRPVTAGAASVTRPTTSSGVPTSRSQVVSGSGSGSGLGADAGRGLGHARAKSSVTTLSSATTLRPPSQTSSSSSTTTATAAGAGAGAGADRSRPSVTSYTRRPSAATSSSSTAAAAPPNRRPLSLSTTTTTSTSSSSSSAPLKHHHHPADPRPAFTTHQQHFSPLRSLAPKPPTATFLAPPSPSKLPANVAASAETARLQAELLQLHLLHRGGRAVVEQWRGSARERLKGRFEALVGEEERVGGVEGVVLEGRGVRDLVRWSSSNGNQGGGGGRDGRLLEEKVQALDGVVSGLWALGEPGGRYERVLGRFERWVRRAEGVMEGRRRKGEVDLMEGGEELVLIGEMDAAWRDECAALGRKLDEWRRTLRELGEVPDPEEGEAAAAADLSSSPQPRSSLARILEGCRALVHGMLAELDILEQIEREAVAEEMRWVREMNRRGFGGADEDAPRAGAIWRVL
ncbi:hypothetical protein VTK56DRAFT_5716 [Thermocarpiscus australiensis]